MNISRQGDLESIKSGKNRLKSEFGEVFSMNGSKLSRQNSRDMIESREGVLERMNMHKMSTKIQKALENSFINVSSRRHPKEMSSKYTKVIIPSKTFKIDMFKLNYDIENPLVLILPFELSIGDKIEISQSGGIIYEQNKDLFMEKGRHLGVNVDKVGLKNYVNYKHDFEENSRVHKLSAVFIPRKVSMQLSPQLNIEEDFIYLHSDLINRSHCSLFVSKAKKPSQIKSTKCRCLIPIKSKQRSFKFCGLFTKKIQKGHAECIFTRTYFDGEDQNLRMRYRIEKTLMAQYTHLDVLLVARVEYSSNIFDFESGESTYEVSETPFPNLKTKKNGPLFKKFNARNQKKSMYHVKKEVLLNKQGSTHYVTQNKNFQSNKNLINMKKKKNINKPHPLFQNFHSKNIISIRRLGSPSNILIKNDTEKVVREYTVMTQSRKLKIYDKMFTKLIEDPKYYIFHHEIGLGEENEVKQTVISFNMSIRYYLHIFLSGDAFNYEQIIGKTELTFENDTNNNNSKQIEYMQTPFNKERARCIWGQIQNQALGVKDLVYLPYSKVSLDKD